MTKRIRLRALVASAVVAIVIVVIAVSSYEAYAANGPTNLTATFVGGDLVLSWTPGTDPDYVRQIVLRKHLGVWTELATLSASATTYTDTTLEPSEKIYLYRVRGEKANGRGGVSNRVRAWKPPCSALSPPVVCQETDTSNPTPTPDPAATATPEPTATPTPSPAATATPEPTATPTPDPTATATPTPNPAATATPSPTATPEPTATPTPDPAATPGPPRSPNELTATFVDGNAVLSWTLGANSNYVRQIILRRYAGAWTELATLSASATTYTDTTLEPNKKYAYRVRGEKANNKGGISNKVSLVHNTEIVPPSELTARVESGSIVLDWTVGTNPRYVKQVVNRRTEGSSVWTQIDLSTLATTYTDTTVVSGTRYIYFIRGEKSNSRGGRTNSVRVSLP